MGLKDWFTAPDNSKHEADGSVTITAEQASQTSVHIDDSLTEQAQAKAAGVESSITKPADSTELPVANSFWEQTPPTNMVRDVGPSATQPDQIKPVDSFVSESPEPAPVENHENTIPDGATEITITKGETPPVELTMAPTDDVHEAEKPAIDSEITALAAVEPAPTVAEEAPLPVVDGGVEEVVTPPVTPVSLESSELIDALTKDAQEPVPEKPADPEPIATQEDDEKPVTPEDLRDKLLKEITEIEAKERENLLTIQRGEDAKLENSKHTLHIKTLRDWLASVEEIITKTKEIQEKVRAEGGAEIIQFSAEKADRKMAA